MNQERVDKRQILAVLPNPENDFITKGWARVAAAN